MEKNLPNVNFQVLGVFTFDSRGEGEIGLKYRKGFWIDYKRNRILKRPFQRSFCWRRVNVCFVCERQKKNTCFITSAASHTAGSLRLQLNTMMHRHLRKPAVCTLMGLRNIILSVQLHILWVQPPQSSSLSLESLQKESWSQLLSDGFGRWLPFNFHLGSNKHQILGAHTSTAK